MTQTLRCGTEHQPRTVCAGVNDPAIEPRPGMKCVQTGGITKCERFSTFLPRWQMAHAHWPEGDAFMSVPLFVCVTRVGLCPFAAPWIASDRALQVHVTVRKPLTVGGSNRSSQ